MSNPLVPDSVRTNHLSANETSSIVNGACPNQNHTLNHNVPVLIVGGGPVGLLSAYLLSKLGVPSLLIEKYSRRLAAPKAHALCPRSLELLRQFGLDTNAIRQLGSPRDDACWVNFLTNLSGERIGRLPYERMDPAVFDDTPEMLHNVPQPIFEEYIAERLKNDPNVTIRKDVAFLSCSQKDGLVHSTVEERSSASTGHITSTYVLACDGARSQVRHMLNIESEGQKEEETMMTIHFHADLKPVVKDRVGILHWIADPACSGFIIAYELGANHVLISNFNSERHPVESWTQELASQTVAAAIGQDIPFGVLSYRPWVLSRKVARQYRSGNVFLVGDAAHSFPPMGGLGLNSGLADAHNLAWKIAAVHQGWANGSILDTYQGDRRQVALVNSAQSVKNGQKIFSFLKTLGTSETNDVDEARRSLYQSIHDSAKQKMIVQAVEDQREHFDNLELHIGYVYGSQEIPPHASLYRPKFVPGARLPHAWIKLLNPTIAQQTAPLDVSYVKEFSSEQVAECQFSTLDLCSFDSMTLIVSSHTGWQQSFKELQTVLRSWNVRLRLRTVGTDFSFIREKQARLYDQEAHFAVEGGLLVRPDQHLLGVFKSVAPSSDLASCIQRYLGL